MRQRHLGTFDAQRVGVETNAIELLGVVKHGVAATLAHVLANAFDHARRRQRFAEDALGQFAAARGDDVALRAQLARRWANCSAARDGRVECDAALGGT